MIFLFATPAITTKEAGHFIKDLSKDPVLVLLSYLVWKIGRFGNDGGREPHGQAARRNTSVHQRIAANHRPVADLRAGHHKNPPTYRRAVPDLDRKEIHRVSFELAQPGSVTKYQAVPTNACLVSHHNRFG